MAAEALDANDIGPVPLTVGVTAHRDPPDAERAAIEARLQSLFDLLEKRYPDTPIQLITALADGGDRIAAHVARDRGIDLVVPLPLPVEEYENDFSAASREEFRELLEAARVVDLPAVAERECRPAADRDEAYARAGAYTSDHCRILVAIWDGKRPAAYGGTADVVEYHQYGRMTRGLGHDEDQAGDRLDRALDDTDVVFHIVCSRGRGDGEPADGLEPGTARWLVADPERREVPGIPAARHLMLQRIDAFNRDQLALSPEGVLGERLPGWRVELAEAPDLARTAAYFARADRLASRFRGRYRAALLWLCLLAAPMGVAFVVYADLDRPSTIVAYLSLCFLGWAIYRAAASREWLRKFLDYRALAEGLRVQFYWRLAGVSGRAGNDSAYDNFLQKREVEIGWIRNVMRYAGAPGARRRVPGEDGDAEADVDSVIRHWVGEPGGRGQLGHFESLCRNRERHAGHTDRLVRAALWAGIAITVVLAWFQRRFDDTAVTAMVAAMGILPLAAAVREAYAHKVAEKELLRQYRFMLRIYRAARFRLDRSRTVEQKRELLRALGEAALEEHAEWILLHRERPLEPAKL